MAYLGPKMVELNELLATMAQRCDEDEKEAWSALSRLQKTFKEKIGLTYALRPKADSELRDRSRPK